MERFTIWFEGSSDGLRLCFRQLQYYRCCSMYMNIRWNHDHEYFQRMIEWEQRVDGEVVGAVITNLRELLNDESSSEDGSMPGLQERGREDSSSSNGSSMPPPPFKIGQEKILPVTMKPSLVRKMASMMMGNTVDTRHVL